MTQSRILSILAPRIHQILNWTFDANALAEPFLKQEDLPTSTQRMLEKWGLLQQNLLPQRAYVPPQLDPKVKG